MDRIWTLGRSFTLDASRVTRKAETGYLHAPLIATRPGVYEYFIQGQRVSVLKPPEHWGGPKFLESLSSVPLTVEHPPKMIDRDNVEQFRVGVTDATPFRFEGGTVHGGGLIMDADTVARVEQGRLPGVSAGSWADWTERSGVWRGVSNDEAPQSYTMVQVNPLANHIALTANPRVPDARFVLDSYGPRCAIAVHNLPLTTLKRMDDTTKELLARLDAAHADLVKAQIETRDSKIKELEREIGQLTATLDSVRQQLEANDAAVTERLALVAEVQAVTDSKPADLLKLKPEALIKAALDSLGVKYTDTASFDRLYGMFEIARDRTPSNSPKGDEDSAAAQVGAAQRQGVTDSKNDPVARIQAAQERRRRKSLGLEA